MQLGDGLSAVVTGGASGLGAATARVLAAEGVKVALFDLDEARGREVAERTGGLFCRCDVTSADAVAAALEQARSEHGTERITVNCAGIAIGKRTVRRDRETGALEPHDLESFSKVIHINLIGSFNVLSQSAAGMLALEPLTPDGGRGVIVNTASVAAQDGQLGQVAYAASKGGVAAMTLPVARDLAGDGVRVVTILPGLFDTPMFATLPDDIRDALGASVPFPSRLGDPQEYAALVRHICENDMLNGECIRLDGAVRLAPK
ncbi:MAG: SDR family NAD(P)-dependent oxidoreductase [Hyphomicrobiales bacterium]|nr:SDR family NAD(P)-dependent oxidoreductase [Hyphomicrobiales bacterium]